MQSLTQYRIWPVGQCLAANRGLREPAASAISQAASAIFCSIDCFRPCCRYELQYLAAGWLYQAFVCARRCTPHAGGSQDRLLKERRVQRRKPASFRAPVDVSVVHPYVSKKDRSKMPGKGKAYVPPALAASTPPHVSKSSGLSSSLPILLVEIRLDVHLLLSTFLHSTNLSWRVR